MIITREMQGIIVGCATIMIVCILIVTWSGGGGGTIYSYVLYSGDLWTVLPMSGPPWTVHGQN